MNEDSENNDDEIKYSPLYGSTELNDISFDHHTLIGINAIRYKPERIKFYYKNEGESKQISGIHVIYRNNMEGSFKDVGINKKEMGGEQLYDEFILKNNDYIVDFYIWQNEKSAEIYKISFKTKLNEEFSVGDEKGVVNHFNLLDGKSYIIMSFFGRYNKDKLTCLGFHYVKRTSYLKFLFTGYFLLKEKLKQESFKAKWLEQIKENKLPYDQVVLIRTALLPNTPFFEVIKFCTL